MNTGIKFHTGCSGFYNAHWRGVFYPEKLPAKQWLDFYSSRLHTVEINATFYKFPDAASLRKWYDKTPEGFVFSVKAPKIITHVRKMEDCKNLLEDFYGACGEGLKEKLGPVLFQLPPGFTYFEEKLALMTENLKPGFTNVVEFRHESWWKESVVEKLKDKDIVFCSVSHPRLPETMWSTGKIRYIRLHGTPRMFYSDYSHEWLEELLYRTRSDPDAEEVYVYFNNTAGTAGILNAVYLQTRLEDLPLQVPSGVEIQ